MKKKVYKGNIAKNVMISVELAELSDPLWARFY